MKLLNDNLRNCLLANGSVGQEVDHVPLAKFFDPSGMATWIISELVPPEGGEGEPDILFGLCDLGFGAPELGYVSLAELESIQGRLGLGIERDIYFEARFPLSVYAHAARSRGRIVETESALIEAAEALGIDIPHPEQRPSTDNTTDKA